MWKYYNTKSEKPKKSEATYEDCAKFREISESLKNSGLSSDANKKQSPMKEKASNDTDPKQPSLSRWFISNYYCHLFWS
jgi:hypothetical protein